MVRARGLGRWRRCAALSLAVHLATKLFAMRKRGRKSRRRDPNAVCARCDTMTRRLLELAGALRLTALFCGARLDVLREVYSRRLLRRPTTGKPEMEAEPPPRPARVQRWGADTGPDCILRRLRAAQCAVLSAAHASVRARSRRRPGGARRASTTRRECRAAAPRLVGRSARRLPAPRRVSTYARWLAARSCPRRRRSRHRARAERLAATA